MRRDPIEARVRAMAKTGFKGTKSGSSSGEGGEDGLETVALASNRT